MIQGIDSGVQGVFFIGYHARMGTRNAILDHTWSSSRVNNLWINGRLCGETGLNASVCGHFGVPLLLVSGDQAVCAEAEEWIPGIETAQVKQATGRHSAECLTPAATKKLITEKAERAISRIKAGVAPAPLHVDLPVTMTIEFIYSDMADRVSLLPGALRLDGRRIEIISADMLTAYTSFRAAVSLAAR